MLGVLHLPQGKPTVDIFAIYWGQATCHLGRGVGTNTRVGLQIETVIYPFLPEILLLIPHQDILRHGRNY